MDLELDLVSSPRTVFRGLLDQASQDLESASHVEEWLGPRRRLPVFDVQPLRDFARAEANRDWLARLLASYIRVASGSVWDRSGGRWRRRRYSELNPLDLAEMGAFSRLGDLSLFLSGVFPEYVARRGVEPREMERISSLLGRRPGEIARAHEPFWIFEWMGRTAYERGGEAGAAQAVRPARRLLNVLTGRHLFPMRDRWFTQPES